MKKIRNFLLAGLCFLLPLALLWVAAVQGTGETIEPDEVIQRQLEDTSTLFGPSYRESYYYYRAAATRTISPDLLILGDSRAGQLRSFFFREPDRVYNACWGAINAADALPFLQSLGDNTPQMLLFSVSHFDFNKNYLNVDYRDIEQFTEPFFGRSHSFALASEATLGNWKGGRLSLVRMAFHSKNLIGVGAIMANAGIMSDGSHYSGQDYTLRDSGGDYLADTLERIENEDYRFVGGDEVNPDALAQMDELLAYCRERGIYVVAYLPPYAPTVNEALEQKRDVYGYHYELAEKLTPLFEKYGFELYDYTDTSRLGCDDDYFLDGFHGSEIVNLRMLLDMLDNGSRLAEWCEESTLQGLEEGRVTNYKLFDTLEEYQKRLPQYAAGA